MSWCELSEFSGQYVDKTGTEIKDKNYEIEIELLRPHHNIDKVERFLANVHYIVQLYNRSNLPYTSTQLKNLVRNMRVALNVKDINEYNIPRQILSRARNARLSDFRVGKGGLIDGEVSYEITHKTDGTRKLLVFSPYGVWLIYPPYEYIKISGVKSDSFTILDVEVVTTHSENVTLNVRNFFSTMSYLIEPIDALMDRGSDLREIKDLNERMTYAIHFRDLMNAPMESPPPDVPTGSSRMDLARHKASNFDIKFKSRWTLRSVDQFFSIVNEIYSTSMPYAIDGLIFTPIWTRYLSESEHHPHEIIKWKPLDDVSIDLRYERTGAGHQLRYIMDDGTEVTFAGDAAGYFPFDANKDLLTGSPLHHGGIYEFKWNPEARKLWPFRERFERSGPNNRPTVMDNWRDMMTPIRLNDLKGLTTYFYRKYHNDIKRGLLTSNPGKILLDLGSGQGGDMERWKNYDRIIAVEPNYGNDPHRFPEFFRRARIHGISDRITLIQAGGQDYSIIVPFVHQLTRGYGVDTISMMDSLTFFWESPEVLASLVQTISSCLARNGRFLWKVMDGDAVLRLMRPPLHGDVRDVMEFGSDLGQKIKIELLENNRVEIYIPGFVEHQTEYLSRISDLDELLEAKGIVPNRRYNASDTTRFITADYWKFSQMYAYGEYVRESNLIMDSVAAPDSKYVIREIDFPVANTSSAITMPAFVAPSASTPAKPIVSTSVFGTPSASTSVFTTPSSSTPIFGTPSSSSTVFSPNKSIFTPSSSSTPVFGTPSASTFVFTTPSSSTPVFATPSSSTPVFATPSSSSTVFSPNKSIFATPSSAAPAFVPNKFVFTPPVKPTVPTSSSTGPAFAPNKFVFTPPSATTSTFSFPTLTKPVVAPVINWKSIPSSIIAKTPVATPPDHIIWEFSRNSDEANNLTTYWSNNQKPLVWVPQDQASMLLESNLVDSEILKTTWATKDRLDIVFDNSLGNIFYSARNTLFSSDQSGSQSNELGNRAADKLITVLNATSLMPQTYQAVGFVDLAAGPGSFTQFFLTRSENNRGYGMTLKSEGTERSGLDWYPALLSNPRFTAYYGVTGDGNIYNTDNIEGLKRLISTNRIDYVTADGGFGIKKKILPNGQIIHQENLQELFSLRLIVSEFLGAIKTLSNEGHFVCKLFDSLSYPTASIIFLTSLIFQKCWVVKPERSRQGNSEKYLVGSGFLADSAVTRYVEQFLENLHRNWVSEHIPSDILPREVLTTATDFLSKVRAMNSTLLSNQRDNIAAIMDETIRRIKLSPEKDGYIKDLQQRLTNTGQSAYLTQYLQKDLTILTN